jgi:hypothetical protein
MRKLLLVVSLLLLVGGCMPSFPSCSNASIGTTTSGVPTIVAFTANPTSITAGQSATLIWNVTNATNIQIDQGVGSGLGAAGTISVSPSSTTTYTFTASNSSGSVTQSVTITVTSSSSTPATTSTPTPTPPTPPGLPPNIVAFDISPNTIHVPPGPGPRTATMHWDVRNAASVTIDGNPEPLSGSRILTPPLGTHTYTLRATNANGTDERTQVLHVVP